MSETNANFCLINPEAKSALICGEVNEEMLKDFFEALDEGVDQIVLTTHGGEQEVALAIYDMLKRLGNIGILATGRCNSAGTLILQGAAKRMATPLTSFRIHYGTEEFENANQAKHAKIMNRYWLEQFAARGISMRKLKRWHAGETYMTAQQALKEGLIDEIVG